MLELHHPTPPWPGIQIDSYQMACSWGCFFGGSRSLSPQTGAYPELLTLARPGPSAAHSPALPRAPALTPERQCAGESLQPPGQHVQVPGHCGSRERVLMCEHEALRQNNGEFQPAPCVHSEHLLPRAEVKTMLLLTRRLLPVRNTHTLAPTCIIFPHLFGMERRGVPFLHPSRHFDLGRCSVGGNAIKSLFLRSR